MKILGIPVHIWRRLYMVNLVIVALIVVIGFGLPSAHAQNIAINSAQDCDANAVMFCGATSVNQLINKYDNGDGRNSAASIQHIYSFFGVSPADVHSMANSSVDVRSGNVNKSGDVFDGSGHQVATGAMTGGRQNMAGSTREVFGGTVFYVRPPSVSFTSSPLHAYVVMVNGKFAFAILASCGNVVKATPTMPAPAPTKPAPTPKPAPKPTPTPTMPAPAPTKPTAKPTTKTSVCTGRTTNSNTNVASQGGNCSTNTTVVQTQTTTPAPAPAPATTTPSPPAVTPSAQVTAPVATAPAPTSLVNTGPGSIAGLFAVTAAVSTLGYRYFLYRRLGQG